MRTAKWKKFAGVTTTLALLVLAACGQQTEDQQAAETPSASEEANGAEGQAPQASMVINDGIIDYTQFNEVKTNFGEAIEGGFLNIGLAAQQPFPGIFNALFSETANDGNIHQWFQETIYSVDDSFQMNQEGAATWTVSEDYRTFTFTIRDNVNWNDGEPVTAYDWLFSLEVLASAEYQEAGFVRFSGQAREIVGIMDFHEGNADHIEGVNVIDEKTLEITFNEASPSIMSGGVPGTVIPRHIFQNIPIAEMADHEASRTNVVSFGPFILDTVVPGEAVTVVRNEDYWQGAPHLAGVNIQVINPELVAAAIRNGSIDVAMGTGFPAGQIVDNADLNNVEWLGRANASYRYIGFNLGTWDAAAGEVVPNPESRVADVRLRQAMWMAIDTDAVATQLFNGLGRAAGGLITPSHSSFFSDTPRPAFNVDAANALLDEAGFLDVDGDGIREDQDGNPFELNMSWNTSDATRETQIAFFVQSWAAVGLNVNAVETDGNSHFERIQEDDPTLDLFYAGWSLGWDVSRAATYGPNSAFNFSRFVSEENTRLVNAIDSVESMDPEVRAAYFAEWEAYMMEQVPVFPILYTYTPTPINNRVHNWRLGVPLATFAHELAVTQETGIAQQ
ncbi:MAG: ABC transporter substrate-binding protein [Turicibacter sp.]|nr:ABC transporter substrate-binding protein [Turicibacter sp.]